MSSGRPDRPNLQPKVHIGNGLFMSNNGYEFGLSLLAASLALLFSGAGRWSIDGRLAHGYAAA